MKADFVVVVRRKSAGFFLREASVLCACMCTLTARRVNGIRAWRSVLVDVYVICHDGVCCLCVCARKSPLRGEHRLHVPHAIGLSEPGSDVL